MNTSLLPLSEICEIRSGYQFRQGLPKNGPSAVPDEGELAHVIQIKDVEGLRFVGTELIQAPVRKIAPYEVLKDDVLFLARAYRFGAILIDSTPPKNTIATHFFFVLRVLPPCPIVPAFLAWSLNRSVVQDKLDRQSHKTHIPVVTRADLESLQLEIPPREIQLSVVALDELRQQEAQVTAEILEKRARLVEAVAEQAMQ
jgi:hypothetical protein